ncbi:protein kinase [Nannocystis sp. RBIL2]|uniref:serine/threonine protein kinase n=1 Tax=Nannocystis sp. RBIL2 TaxID=2996788 RepID=UPI00226EB305|nr:serine/threonine-protein kinase [Nannocystis sp. RBIL2]MCY1072642.1 protein kinase [Nannocystis sp. RBIL2]
MLGQVVTDASEARAKVGDVLGERWELRGPAGGGGLGQVFLAWDRERRQTCALKLFDAAAVSSEAFRRYTEALRSAAAVSHPAVVLPQTPVVAGGPRFAVGEWVAGADLDTLRASGGPLQWSRAAEIVSTCADALAAVHEATGLAHRALKPGNVRITESSQVRLLDLGIAEIAVSPVAPRPGGAFVDYRAPEQIEGQAGDARSDVFTLAVLLFEATTGVHPFTASSAFKAAHRALQSTPDLSTAGLPAQARPLLTRALARRPEERHANAREFLRALTLVRQSVGGMAPRATAGDNAPTAEPADEPAPVADPTTQLRIPVARPKPPIAAAESPVRGPNRDAAFAAPVAPATADSPPAADEPELLGSGTDRPIPAQPPAANKPTRESLQQLDTGRLVTPEPSTERDARRPASPELTMQLPEPAKVPRRSGSAERDSRQAAPKAARTRPEPNTVPAPQDLPAEWITTERDFRRPSPAREATVALPLSGELSEKPGRRTAHATDRPPAESTVALPLSGELSSKPGTTVPERRRPTSPDKTAPQASSEDPSRQPALPADWTTTARDGRRPTAPETTMALAHDDGLTEKSGLPAAWTTTERDGRRPAPESTIALPDPARLDPGAHEDAATTAMPTLRPRPKRPVPEDTSEDPDGDERTRALPRMTGRAPTEGRPESTIVLDQGGARPAEATLALPDPKDIPARNESTRVVSNSGEQVRAMRSQRPAGAATPREPAAEAHADKPWLSPRGLMFFNIGLGVLILAALAVVLTR